MVGFDVCVVFDYGIDVVMVYVGIMVDEDFVVI